MDARHYQLCICVFLHSDLSVAHGSKAGNATNAKMLAARVTSFVTESVFFAILYSGNYCNATINTHIEIYI